VRRSEKKATHEDLALQPLLDVVEQPDLNLRPLLEVLEDDVLLGGCAKSCGSTPEKAERWRWVEQYEDEGDEGRSRTCIPKREVMGRGRRG
jgi:hypothetical protein